VQTSPAVQGSPSSQGSPAVLSANPHSPLVHVATLHSLLGTGQVAAVTHCGVVVVVGGAVVGAGVVVGAEPPASVPGEQVPGGRQRLLITVFVIGLV
jgi:hypothetical protein